MHLLILGIGAVPVLWALNLEREKARYDNEHAE
jgi:ketopantoate reductase